MLDFSFYLYTEWLHLSVFAKHQKYEDLFLRNLHQLI